MSHSTIPLLFLPSSSCDHKRDDDRHRIDDDRNMEKGIREWEKPAPRRWTFCWDPPAEKQPPSPKHTELLQPATPRCQGAQSNQHSTLNRYCSLHSKFTSFAIVNPYHSNTPQTCTPKSDQSTAPADWQLAIAKKQAKKAEWRRSIKSTINLIR